MLAAGQEGELTGDEATHLARVLRVRPGDAVEVFDGGGASARCEVVAVSRRAVTLRGLGPGAPDRALPFALDLVVAPPKGRRAQRLVEGLTELGVSSLAPLQLRRGQVTPPSGEAITRWSREACKQCGRSTLLAAAGPYDLADLIAAAEAVDLALLADPGEDAAPLREVTARPGPGRCLVAVGPEGGVAPDERARLIEAGLAPVRLGPTVLRIETAAQAVAACLVGAWS